MKRQKIGHSYGEEEELEDPDDFQAELEKLFQTAYLPYQTSLMVLMLSHNREYKRLYRRLRASSCPSRVSACPRAYVQSKWCSPQGTPSHLVLNRRKLVTWKKKPKYFQFLPGSLKGRVKLLKCMLKWAFATCHLARTIHVARTLVVMAYALRIARAAVIIEMCKMQFYRVLLRG